MSDYSTKIMIADNDEIFADTFRGGLQLAGYLRTTTVTSQSEVIPSVKRQKPDVILLDIQWPIRNGSERLEGSQGTDMIAAIRQDPDVAGTRIVCISGGLVDQGDDRAYSYQPGGYWLVPKLGLTTDRLVAFLQAKGLA